MAAFRQQNEFIDVLLGAHDKASALLGKGELICEAREILHFYQYQTDSDAAFCFDGDATISASGDNVFTETDDKEEGVSNRIHSADETVFDQSSSFITVDVLTSVHSFHSAHGVHSAASAVTEVRTTADEMCYEDKSNECPSSSFAIDQ